MSEEYHIDQEQRVIWTRCWGVLSDEDVVRHQDNLKADPLFMPTLNQLVDAREVTEVTVSARTVRQLGQSKLFTPESRRAYVVTKDVIFGLVRMYELYQSLRGAQNVRVFRERAGAVAWLNVTDPAAAPPPRRPDAG